MKPDIHPKYKEVKVNCSCGSVFTIFSTYENDTMHVDICSSCHPFYTGKQRIVDTAGRVDRFKQRYSKPVPVKVATKVEAAEKSAEPSLKTGKKNTQSATKKAAAAGKTVKKTTLKVKKTEESSVE